MSDRSIILIGYSGHGIVVAEAAISAGLPLLYYADKTIKEKNIYGLEYLGDESETAFKGWDMPLDFILGIGDNKLRQKIAQHIFSKGKIIQTVVHPSASISANAEIGGGTFISRNASVNPLASIGKYCILNTACIIEHECILHEAVHVAPGAVLAGSVTVGERTFIGANAVIKQGVTIGSDVIIGAGTVVLNDVPDNQTIIGNPGRKL